MTKISARLVLAALLVLQPVVQAAELAPVDILLTRAIPQDEVLEPDGATGQPGDPDDPDPEEVKEFDRSFDSHRKSAKDAESAAKQLGYDKKIPTQKAPFNSHGQPVFRKGNKYITPDTDGHRGGVWKMFNRAGQRLGTFDKNLVRIGD